MSFTTGQGRKIVDSKICYELWAKRRYSLYQIPQILKDEHGIVNPRTGEKLTPQGIERSAWLYALEHLDEAKTDTVSILEADGKAFDLEGWYREIVMKAKRFYGKSRQREFIRKNPQLFKYFQNEI